MKILLKDFDSYGIIFMTACLLPSFFPSFLTGNILEIIKICDYTAASVISLHTALLRKKLTKDMESPL